MKIGVITGTVVSTVKYERYRGMKMLKARNLTLAGSPRGRNSWCWTRRTPGSATSCC